MDTEGPKTGGADTDEAFDGEFSVQLNRKVMGGWLAATCAAALLAAVALIAGVGNAIDWILLAAFMAISAVIAMHLFDKHPVLIINQDGVHDRRISRHLIPWNAMLWHKIEAQTAVPILAVGLTDEAAKKVGVYTWAFLYKNQPAPFGKLKGYRIWPERTLGKGHDFTRAVQRFAPLQDDR